MNTLKGEPRTRIAFAGLVYDEEARQLLRGGVRLDLTPKAFELLGLLLKNRPRALSKAELRDRLWPSTFVNDSSLAQVVAEIRRTLGDDARSPRLIRTVYGFGYAFAAGETATEVPVAVVPPSEASGWLVWGPNELALHAGENLIGRDPDCVVRVNSPQVSRHHARLVLGATGATLEDLGSKNGTFLEGRQLEGALPLHDGDEVVIGPAVLVFRDSGATGTTATASRSRPRR